MKKITILLLLLISISTALTSCAGIGDGALPPSYDATSAEMPDSPSISSNISIWSTCDPAMTCDIKSYGYSEDIDLRFKGNEGLELWQIACYHGRADYSEEGRNAKGEGAYFDISCIYNTSGDLDSSLRIYENDVVCVTKKGPNIMVLSTSVVGLREGIFAEIEKYLGLE